MTDVIADYQRKLEAEIAQLKVEAMDSLRLTMQIVQLEDQVRNLTHHLTYARNTVLAALETIEDDYDEATNMLWRLTGEERPA